MGIAGLVISWAWSPYWLFPGARDYALLVLLPALLLSYLIGLYYRGAYGDVRTRPGLYAKRSALKWFIVYPAIAAALVVDGVLALPVLVSPFVFAVAIVDYWRSTGRGRLHHLAGAAALAAIGVASALGLLPMGRDSFAIIFGTLGLLYTIGGVLDHLEMRQRLHRLPTEDT